MKYIGAKKIGTVYQETSWQTINFCVAQDSCCATKLWQSQKETWCETHQSTQHASCNFTFTKRQSLLLKKCNITLRLLKYYTGQKVCEFLECVITSDERTFHLFGAVIIHNVSWKGRFLTHMCDTFITVKGQIVSMPWGRQQCMQPPSL